MFPVSRISRFAFAFAALLAVFFSAQAGADPAGRVGRVALLDGPTLFRVDRADAGSPASVNWPVSSGAIFDTERGSRAEIWVGSTAFRLAGDTRLEFSAIDDRLLTLQLATGTLSIVVRDREQAADLDLRLPDGRVQFVDAGRYRIDVGPERSSIAVDAGQAVVHAGNGSLSVGPGRTADLDAGGRLALYGEAARDAFDDWVAERDVAMRVRAASRYVSPQMTGYQDLDGYGDWDTVSDYGTVWYPRAVPTGWAPYRYGRWAWVAPWGWTWVDAAPWGFAPFHYGRWIEVRGRWGWVPGRYVPRPVYAPALVAWIGNAGWSVGLSAGRAPAVGWFPLAPREVYVPSYRASTTYVRQINVTQITNVTVINEAVAGRGERRFANRASPRAVTVVPVGTVREGRAVAAAALPVRDQRELRQAPLSARAPTGNWLAPDTAATRPQGERSGRGERGGASFAQPGGERAPRDAPRLPQRPTAGAPAVAAPGTPAVGLNAPNASSAPDGGGRGNRGREISAEPRQRNSVEPPRPAAPFGGAPAVREPRPPETQAPAVERRRMESPSPADQGLPERRQQMPRQPAAPQAEQDRMEQQRQAEQARSMQRQTEQRQELQRQTEQRQEQQRQEVQRQEMQRQAEQRQSMQRQAEQNRIEQQRQAEQRQLMQRQTEQRQEMQRQEGQRQEVQRQAEQRQSMQRQEMQRQVEQQRQAEQRQLMQRQNDQRQMEQRQSEQRQMEQRRAPAPAEARSPESRREGGPGRGERDGGPGR